jgi:hypothetical protein
LGPISYISSDAKTPAPGGAVQQQMEKSPGGNNDCPRLLFITYYNDISWAGFADFATWTIASNFSLTSGSKGFFEERQKEIIAHFCVGIPIGVFLQRFVIQPGL